MVCQYKLCFSVWQGWLSADTLVRPPYSPDISQIENLWGALKNEVNLTGTIDDMEIETKLVEIWEDEKIRKNCKTLIASMPKRVNAILQSRGGLIKY